MKKKKDLICYAANIFGRLISQIYLSVRYG